MTATVAIAIAVVVVVVVDFTSTHPSQQPHTRPFPLT